MRNRLILAMGLWATQVVAGPFDGVYRQAANADCALVGVDGGAVEIREGVFYGVDANCQMTKPVDVVDMQAVLYHMQCANDDSHWVERAMILNKAERDGIIMVWDGYAFVYDKCTETPDQLPIND